MATITDNDVPGLIATGHEALVVTEGGEGDTFSIQLKTKPTAPVTLNFIGDKDIVTGSAMLTAYVLVKRPHNNIAASTRPRTLCRLSLF